MGKTPLITITSRNSKRNSFCKNYTYNYIFESVRNLNCNHFGADSTLADELGKNKPGNPASGDEFGMRQLSSILKENPLENPAYLDGLAEKNWITQYFEMGLAREPWRIQHFEMVLAKKTENAAFWQQISGESSIIRCKRFQDYAHPNN